MSIVDSDKKQLNPVIWLKRKEYDNYYTLRAEIYHLIVKPLYQLFKKLKIPTNLIAGIYIVGSNATTRFREDSDVDVNVIVDADPKIDLLDLVTEVLKINGKLIPNTKHEINYYITSQEHQKTLPQAYDVVNGEWMSTENVKHIDVELYKKYAQGTVHDVNNMLFDLEANIIDYKDMIYMSSDNKMLDIKVQNKLKEIEHDMTDIKNEYKRLRLKRIDGFTDESYNNIVYKLLDKYRLLSKMLKVKKLLSDGFQEQDIIDYTERFKFKKNLTYYNTIIQKLKERLKI